MHKTHFALLLTAAALSPLALAHPEMGTPNLECETPYQWSVHDYALPGATVDVLKAGRGQPALHPIYDGNTLGDCDEDGTVGDYDSHDEFGFGHAILAVTDYAVYSEGGQVGAGSYMCLCQYGHHPAFPTIYVDDVALPDAEVLVRVGSDRINNVPPVDPNASNCGDFEDDLVVEFIGSGSTIPIPPGLDGSYHVYVTGTAGHVWT